jgi:hypothetical protein
LCDEEVAYITEVNDLYYLLLKDLAPIFNPDMTAPDVVQLQEGGQSLSLTSPERGKEKMSAAVSSIVKDKGTLDEDLLLRDEEIATFKTMYIQRVREKLVRHGIVVQKSTFSQNLRYVLRMFPPFPQVLSSQRVIDGCFSSPFFQHHSPIVYVCVYIYSCPHTTDTFS